jgi:predicted amidohydrolase
MKPFSVAAIQMRILPQSNVERLCTRIELAVAAFPWIQMVVLSELASFGPGLHHAETLPGPTEDTYRNLAAKLGIWLLPGSLYERVGEHVYNTTPVITPNGAVVARYRKMFPFRPYEQGVTPGTEFVVFDVAGAGRFGVSICYDMWFPETTRTLASMGAEVVLHPTLTDTLDREIELSIARTNAAINQCYFFDVNGLGNGGYGRSIVIGPSGDVIHQSTVAEEVMPIEIDLARVRRERNVGLHGLGQPLKSFRDRNVDFNVYRPDGFDFTYLHALGPLERADRRSTVRGPSVDLPVDSPVDSIPPTEQTPN